MVGPERPLPNRRGAEAVVRLALVAHREGRGWIETAGKQFSGTVHKRLAGTADDSLAGACQAAVELAGLLRFRVGGDDKDQGATSNFAVVLAFDIRGGHMLSGLQG